MVGNTGRKCSSHGINVIGGGSKSMEDLYKRSFSEKSRKFRLQNTLYCGCAQTCLQYTGLALAKKWDGAEPVPPGGASPSERCWQQSFSGRDGLRLRQGFLLRQGLRRTSRRTPPCRPKFDFSCWR